MIWTGFWYGAIAASFVMVLVFQAFDEGGNIPTVVVAMWGLLSTLMLAVSVL